MEEKELQELERALQAATPAPWRASRTGMGRSRVAAPLQVRTLGGEVVSTEDACNAAVCADHEDAAAIAALRNAAPALLAELREARRLLGESANGLRGLLCLPHPPDRDSRRVVEIAGDTLAAVDTFLEEGSDCEQSEPNRSENGKD